MPARRRTAPLMAAEPEETVASECRPSGKEFEAEWNAACLDED